MRTSSNEARRLLHLLDSHDPDQRVSAADAIAKAQLLRAGPALMNHLDDPAGAVRRASAEALGRLAFSDAARPIADHLRNETSSLARVCMAEALGEIGVVSAEVISALTTALNDRVPLVRAYAAESLGRLRAHGAEDAIRSRLSIEGSTRARASMLEALTRLGDERALQRLLRMLTRVKDWGIRTAILNMLRYLRDDAQDPRFPYIISEALQDLDRRDPRFTSEQQRWWTSFAKRISTRNADAHNLG